MNLFEPLLSWLQSKRDFAAGLALYKQFSKNKALIARFDRLGDIPYHRQLLLNEITTHCKGLEADHVRSQRKATRPRPAPNLKPETSTEPKAPSPKVNPQPETFTRTDLALLPPDVQRVHIEKAQLFVEASRLHNVDLPKAATDQERAEIAEQIMQKMHRNNELWEAWRHYEKSGKLPPGFFKPAIKKDDPLLKLTTAQLIQRRNNRRTNISQYKKWIEANPEDHPNMPGKVKKLEEWTAEIIRIEQLIEKGS